MPNTVIDSFSDEFEFLSNFYPHRVLIREQVAPTVEHAYQAAKTLDKGQFLAILAAPTAGAARKLGRVVPLHPDWKSLKEAVMLYLLCQKFSERTMRGLLEMTEPMVLVAGNAWGDTYWGVCDGKGKNRLGVLLMTIRDLNRGL